MLSIVPAVSPILKAPAWIPPTVAGPITTCKQNPNQSHKTSLQMKSTH